MTRSFGLRNLSYSKASAAIALIGFVLIVSYSCPSSQAQTKTDFTTQNKFELIANNGTFSFAVNGSYSAATQQNGAWIFTDLLLNGSTPIASLRVSTENSNVTIYYYRVRNTTLPSEQLRYNAQGEGKVTVNFGASTKDQWGSYAWGVTKSVGRTTVFFSEKKDYTLTNDGSLIVNSLSGNISITHYFFSGILGDNPNLPFYQQHSVAITVIIIVAAAVIITVVVHVRTKPLSEEKAKSTELFSKGSQEKQPR